VITLSNDHKFEFMTASGALAYDGQGWPWERPLRWVGLLDPTLFTNVTKTLTRLPRAGNLRWSHPWSVVKQLAGGGVVNAIGLTNPGIDWWIEKVGPMIPKDIPIVVSIEARDELEVAEMIQLLEGQRIVAVELNLSCPNTKDHSDRTTEKILAVARHADQLSRLPLIAKLSYTQDHVTIAKELALLRQIQAISINSVPWAAIFPDRPSPLSGFGGGGVSGKVVQDYTWEMVAELSRATKIPVIGPSVWEYEDIRKVIDKGAKAVSFGSVFVHHPWRATRFVRRWIRENIKKEPVRR
jgi:dihydroorotate dehydrogenase